MDAADLHSVTFPVGAVLPGAFALIDGAVAELQAHEDGSVTAEIRIPARQPERM